MRLFFWPRTFASIAVGAAAASSFACCMAFGEDPVTLQGETAIIVWDAKRKRQHFIRQAEFGGEARHFGFIVPTPTQPEIDEAEEAAFERLYRYDRALVRRRSPVPPAASADEPMILEQIRVGDYEATVMRARDADKMLDWLRENGYVSRPAMKPWLEHYAKKEWVFTALKFVREPDSEAPETKALRLSFDADRPHYPYKMPEDTWPEGHVRPLRLFYIGERKAGASYADSPTRWEAENLGTIAIRTPDLAPLAQELGLRPEDLPAKAVLTVFHNGRNEQGYDHDLTFTETSGAREAAPWALGIGLGFAGGFVYLRRYRKLASDGLTGH
jgi:hypothetical protein